jgi:hypothetical protein
MGIMGVGHSTPSRETSPGRRRIYGLGGEQNLLAAE